MTNPAKKGIHPDWLKMNSIQELVDGLAANAMADSALRQDIEDALLRAQQLECARCSSIARRMNSPCVAGAIGG